MNENTNQHKCLSLVHKYCGKCDIEIMASHDKTLCPNCNYMMIGFCERCTQSNISIKEWRLFERMKSQGKIKSVVSMGVNVK